MDFNFRPMDNKYAKEILNWHYDKEYSFYDMEFDSEDLEEFLMNMKRNYWENKFVVLNKNENLIGIFSYEFKDNVMEIGLGLKPNLTGKGIGESYIRAGIEYGKNKFKYNKNIIKLAVASFNKRAIKVYERLGFKETGRYIENISDKKYEFIIMTLNLEK
ncbi:GNAT family N-acetyltransferase [Clostridium sp. ATCC 25772]|uniref:GNAT family N-acetyltransferase n=1 Tax=Clostridium sp. ATCC 25772 TaxID=1676991 RepID=UPI00078049DF|nr:GNAT family N-acetyltransferase [Clostridium sp. ATCC 25772]